MGGRCTGVISELTLGERLVKPKAMQRPDIVRAYLSVVQTRRFFTAVPVTRDILIGAAGIRASSGLKLPDAIHVSTARLTGCDALLTNDKQFRAVPDVEVVLLGEQWGRAG